MLILLWVEERAFSLLKKNKLSTFLLHVAFLKFKHYISKPSGSGKTFSRHSKRA